MISSIYFNSSTSQLSDLHIILVSFYCQEVISEQARWMRITFPLISIVDLPSGSLSAWMPCHFPKTPIEHLQTLQCSTFLAIFHTSPWWWRIGVNRSEDVKKEISLPLFSIYYGYINYKNLERFAVQTHFAIIACMWYLKMSIVNVTLKMF